MIRCDSTFVRCIGEFDMFRHSKTGARFYLRNGADFCTFRTPPEISWDKLFESSSQKEVLGFEQEWAR